jgi:low iron-inducible protein
MTKRTVAGLAVLTAMALSLSGCSDPVKPAAASPTTTTTEPPVTPSGPLGEYQPVSDVAQHARMSLDVCEINRLLDARPVDFAGVAAIYRNGKFSDESEGVKRTLGKFAGESRAAEDTLGRYERYLGVGWLNAFVGDAIDGVGAFQGASEAVRREAVRIGIRDQIMAAATLHELDAAVDKAGKASYTKKSGAPHNWDEVWAYYHGDKPECSPFSTAQAAEQSFGVGTLITRRLQLFAKDGLKALVDKKAPAARTAREQMVRDITTSYVQSVILAASKIDAAVAGGKADEARVSQAQGWAYYRVIEPLIARANTTAAEAIAAVFNLASKPTAGSAAKVTAAFITTYGPLGISAADVGALQGDRGPTGAPAAEDEGPDDDKAGDGR